MRDYCGLLGRPKSRDREAQQIINKTVAFRSHGSADRGANRFPLLIHGKPFITLNRAKILKVEIGKCVGQRGLDALKTAPIETGRKKQEGKGPTPCTSSAVPLCSQGSKLGSARLSRILASSICPSTLEHDLPAVHLLRFFGNIRPPTTVLPTL